MRFAKTALVCSSVLGAVSIAACGDGDMSGAAAEESSALPQGSEQVSLDPG